MFLVGCNNFENKQEENNKETPQTNTDIEYEDDIDLFNQYMDYFSDAVYELD